MQNKTPNKRKSIASKNAENSPAQKTPKQEKTPKKSPEKQPNKRKSLENGSTPPKKQKIAPFAGTKTPEANGAPVESKENRAKRRRGRMGNKRALTKTKVADTINKLKSGDEEAVKKIKEKYEALKQTPNRSSTAQRKMRKLKGLLQKAGILPPTEPTEKKVTAKKAPADKKKPQAAKKPAKKTEEEEESEESDYDAESQIKPDKIAKNMNEESEDSEDDDDDDEEDVSDEEESDDEEAPQKVLPKKQDKKALGLHNTFVKGRKVNVQYTQGGKKKGDEAKKEIKSKNLKLQAMRKKGQLAGGVNESQKRSQRRGKNAAA